jgi:5-methyltetrahydropteroyltriglutamate--homocysteine methyltransferase
MILTTHTGSLPRPPGLDDLTTAVADVVRRQREAGIDVVNDGEASKPSYATYVTERLTGFEGEPIAVQWRGKDAEDFPEYFERLRTTGLSVATPPCTGPVAYQDTSKVETDIANLKAASGQGETELFLSAASPGIVAQYMPNQFYASEEEYIFAIADAMKTEYDAIHQAGILLQLDCPDLPGAAKDDGTKEFRRRVAIRLQALDHATRDIPPERLRMHLCWGNGEAPHHNDVPLADFVDLVLAARPSKISLEGANPRHEHEWAVFEDVKLPEGKMLIPGVLDSTTNFVEHPELVAQRLIRYAGVVGRENVMAGTDCGFATFAEMDLVDPRIAWAKLAAMAEGAQRANDRLWSRSA